MRIINELPVTGCWLLVEEEDLTPLSELRGASEEDDRELTLERELELTVVRMTVSLRKVVRDVVTSGTRSVGVRMRRPLACNVYVTVPIVTELAPSLSGKLILSCIVNASQAFRGSGSVKDERRRSYAPLRSSHTPTPSSDL
jgi:hypothetical protein